MSVTKDGRVAVEGLPEVSADTPVSVTVGVASGSVLAQNNNRKGATFVNLSTNRISFGLGQAAVLNKGITLMPNGGTWSMDQFTFTTVQIFAIAAGAGSELSVQEFD